MATVRTLKSKTITEAVAATFDTAVNAFLASDIQGDDTAQLQSVTYFFDTDAVKYVACILYFLEVET